MEQPENKTENQSPLSPIKTQEEEKKEEEKKQEEKKEEEKFGLKV